MKALQSVTITKKLASRSATAHSTNSVIHNFKYAVRVISSVPRPGHKEISMDRCGAAPTRNHSSSLTAAYLDHSYRS